jgi:hypothetical protein
VEVLLDIFICEVKLTQFLKNCMNRALKLLKMGEAVTNEEV